MEDGVDAISLDTQDMPSSSSEEEEEKEVDFYYLQCSSMKTDTMENDISTSDSDDNQNEKYHLDEENESYLPLAPVNFTCGSFSDPYEYLGDIDCAFVFSSCMTSELMAELSAAFGRHCKPGTIVITTEFPLILEGVIEPLEDDKDMPFGPYQIDLVENLDGYCWLTGGCSTAYIHRVTKSLW
eukprot:7717122-Ditylum_brightwellii.AAC.1